MAQIPLGEFGLARAVPRAQPSRVDLSGSMQVGQAIERAADTLGAVAGQMGQQASAMRQEANQQAEALARAKAANAIAEHRLQVSGAVTDVEDQLRRGLDFTQAPQVLDERIGKIEVPRIEGLDPAAMEAFSGGIEQARTAARLQVDGAIVSARRDAGQTEFTKLLDTLGRSVTPAADVGAINAQARAALPLFREFGLDGSTLEKGLQEFEKRNWTNHANQRFNAVHDDVAGLQALQVELASDEGAYAQGLDPTTRSAAVLRVSERIDTLNNRAAAAQDRLAAAAESALTQMDEQFSSGVPATIEQWTAWAGAVEAAPQFKPQFEARMKAEQEVQTFLRQPIDVQQRGLAEREAALLREGGDPQDRANHARLAKAVEANLKMLREDPLQYAAARMDETIEPLPMAGLADPAQAGALAAALQHRATVVGGLRRQYGPQVQQALLRSEERDALATALRQAGPDQQMALFGRLRQATGSPGTYRAVMEQIAPDAPLLAYAGEVAVRPGGTKAASLLLRGAQLLEGKGDQKVKMPTDNHFTQAFLDEAGNAYQGRAADMQRDLAAARAVYAASAVTDGDTEAQTQFNDRRFANAMRAIVGEFAQVGDTQVVTPWGMDVDTFESRVENPMRLALQAAGYDRRVLDSAGEAIGLMNGPRPGLYILIQGRTPVWNPKVTREDGRAMPVFIDLGAP